MKNENREIDGEKLRRRMILRGAGIATGSALIGSTFSGSAAAGCGKDFDCEEGGLYLKYEFDDDDCTFKLAESPSDFDEEDFTFQSAGNKEGEECEPIFVEWQSDEYEVVKLLAKAGPNCQNAEDPEEGLDSPFKYEVDQKNKGGNQAAISNVQLCLRKRDDDPVLGDWQVDLIYGDPIFDFSAAGSYSDGNRLLQALRYCGGEYKQDLLFDQNTDEYKSCFDDEYLTEENPDEVIVQDIRDEGDGTATAKLDPGSCDGEDFALVSYTTEECNFAGGSDQILKDSDETGTEGEDSVYTYEVELPEVEE